MSATSASGAPVRMYHSTGAIHTPDGMAEPKHAVFNASSAGANLQIAGVRGYRILPLQYVIVASDGVTVTFESEDGTQLSGPMVFAKNGTAAPSFNPLGQVAPTKTGEGLVIYLSGAVQVGGHAQYVLVK